MDEPNFCAFREYRADIGMWYCMWKYESCERLTVCAKPPKMER